MDLIASLYATPRTGLLLGTLAPHMDAYTATLLRGRCAANTTKKYIAGAEHECSTLLRAGLLDGILEDAAIM